MKSARKKTLKLVELYNSLSDNQRSQFWGAAINVFLIIFTFWLGLTVQLVVVDTNKSYNEELIKMQYQEKLKEDRYKLNIAISLIYECDLLQKVDKPDDMRRLLLNYDKFKKGVVDFYLIEDSLLSVCEELRWHIKSKVDLKQFDDSLRKCFLDINMSLLLLSGKNEIEITNNFVDFLDKNEVRKRFGGFNSSDKEKLINEYRPSVKKFLSADLLKREEIVVDNMAVLAGRVSFIVNLIQHEMKEYDDCGFINKLSDSSPFFKSLILLIVCLGMSIPISALILHKIHIPSTDRGYTKEEGSMILKERDEWKSRAKELDCMVLLQNDKIKILEQKYDDLRDDYMDVLAELGERNSLDKSPN